MHRYDWQGPSTNVPHIPTTPNIPYDHAILLVDITQRHPRSIRTQIRAVHSQLTAPIKLGTEHGTKNVEEHQP